MEFPLLASVATAALVMVMVVDPYAGTYANAAAPAQWQRNTATQVSAVAVGSSALIARDAVTIIDPPPPVVVAAAPGVSDPAGAKAIAAGMVEARGWGSGQFDCLVSLWNKESGWNMYAKNKSSGAYGIPQSYPGNKMASAGADWETNATTQITWGLGYIAARYSTPCGAWNTSQAQGSY